MNRLATSYRYEMKKMLIVRRGWIFLLGIILLQICIACLAKPSEIYTFDKELYKGYIEHYGGEYSTETEQAIQAEMAELAEGMRQSASTEMTSAFEMTEQSDKQLLNSMKYNALMELDAKYSRLASCRDFQPILTYDVELLDYIKKFGICWVSLIGMMFLIPLFMLGDAICGMEQILFPTATGRKTIVVAKLLAAVTIGIGVTVVCSVVQWAIISAQWDLGRLDVPIQSISGFEQCTVDISAKSCILLFGAIRILAAPAASLMLCALSVIIRKEPAIIATAAILIGASAFAAGKYPLLSAYCLFSALGGIETAASYSLMDILLLVVVLLLKIFLFGVIVQMFVNKKR